VLEKGKTFLEWQLQDDLEAIRTHYVTNGFIDASVSEERKVLIEKRRIDIGDFRVRGGKQTLREADRGEGCEHHLAEGG